MDNYNTEPNTPLKSSWIRQFYLDSKHQDFLSLNFTGRLLIGISLCAYASNPPSRADFRITKNVTKNDRLPVFHYFRDRVGKIQLT